MGKVIKPSKLLERRSDLFDSMKLIFILTYEEQKINSKP
jgi:hypothetical protein